MKAVITACALGCCAPLSVAGDAGRDNPADAPQPPVLPPQVESGEALEPEVTIIQTEKGVIREYRTNGKLYMVKITPRRGPPYYLFDTDGDGQLDTRSDSMSNISVQQWILFSW